MKIVYYCGTQSSGNMDIAEVHYDNGDVCAVCIPYYMNGRKQFPCASGKDVSISGALAQRINAEASKRFEVEHITPSKFRELRVKLERLLKLHKTEFYDWKSAVDWACAELDISSQLFQCMYPTQNDYLGIMEFRHLTK